MKANRKSPRSAVIVRRPEFHRDLFETLLVSLAGPELASNLGTLMPAVAERAMVANDFLEYLNGRRAYDAAAGIGIPGIKPEPFAGDPS